VAEPLPAGLPTELVTDRQRLRQILHNLLSNGVKFTDQGRVELRITASTAPGAGDPVVAFAVTDTGVGISEHNLEVIFGAFQQGDGTTSRRHGGTGLGLAICRELATQLGGRITAESVPGEGSTFTLFLPVRLPPADDRAPAAQPTGLVASNGAAGGGVGGASGVGGGSAVAGASGAGWAGQAGQSDTKPAGSPPDPPAAQHNRRSETPPGAHDSLRGKRVLIVDDDMRNAFAITSILELYGMTVRHAPDGRTGIEILRATPGIDIVLMDVMMPEQDGYTTTGAIRKIPELGGLPVIAVTARAMQGDRDKSLAAGATDYITKPVDTEELLSCMERWVKVPGARET
jgi:CheY-like chemotaxis protein